jgi:hypothetical protein
MESLIAGNIAFFAIICGDGGSGGKKRKHNSDEKSGKFIHNLII